MDKLAVVTQQIDVTPHRSASVQMRSSADSTDIVEIRLNGDAIGQFTLDGLSKVVELAHVAMDLAVRLNNPPPEGG